MVSLLCRPVGRSTILSLSDKNLLFNVYFLFRNTIFDDWNLHSRKFVLATARLAFFLLTLPSFSLYCIIKTIDQGERSL